MTESEQNRNISSIHDLNDACGDDDMMWDRNYKAGGPLDIFFGLDNVKTFVEKQDATFQRDMARNPQLKEDEAFLVLPTGAEENVAIVWYRIQADVLQPRGLHVASALIQRVLEGKCPPRVRIASPLGIADKLELPSISSSNASEKLEIYEDSLRSLTTLGLFVAPKADILAISSLLTNIAHYHLIQGEFQQAGRRATDALMYDGYDDQARICRAKASLGIGGVSHLVQAEEDLEQIALNEERYSTEAVAEAKQLLDQHANLLVVEQQAFLRDQSQLRWELVVRGVKSRCW